MLVVAIVSWTPALAGEPRDMVDAKGAWTEYGIAISLVAAAQVSEMRCGKKDWISAAITKVGQMGIKIDVNDKYDYASIVGQASDILSKAQSTGITRWCATTTEKIGSLIGAR